MWRTFSKLLIVWLPFLVDLSLAQTPDDYVNAFASETPEQQVLLWKQGWTGKDRIAADHLSDLTNVMLDQAQTANSISSIFEDMHAPSQLRLQSWVILSAMDRYRRFPSWYPTDKGVRAPKGVASPYAVVNGNRIGKEVFERIRAVSLRDADPLIRALARQDLGLTKADVANRPIEERVRTWISATKKAKGMNGYGSPAWMEKTAIELSFFDSEPSYLPSLLTSVVNENDPYVNEAFAELIATVDGCSVRLRNEPQAAGILAFVPKLFQRKMLPLYKSKDDRQRRKRALDEQVFSDSFRLDETSELTRLAIALKEKFNVSGVLQERAGHLQASPQMTELVSFITSKDHFYPRWSYSGCPNPDWEFIHPQFDEKLDKWHQYYLEFKK